MGFVSVAVGFVRGPDFALLLVFAFPLRQLGLHWKEQNQAQC